MSVLFIFTILHPDTANARKIRCCLKAHSSYATSI